MTNIEGIDWKWLNDEYKYKVCRDGNIYSIMTNKFMLSYKKHNYMVIELKNNGKKSPLNLAKLIYETFNEPIEKGYQIIHLDNNITNNALINLKKLLKQDSVIQKLDTNIWKLVPNYENRYAVNKKGEIFSMVKNKILVNNNPEKNNLTFKKFLLIDDKGNKKNYFVHNLIYSAYYNISIDDLENKKYMIEHIDGNTLNNSLDNLRLIAEHNEKQQLKNDDWKWFNNEKIYRIYKDGRIYSTITNKFIETYIKEPNPYPQIELKTDGKIRQYTLNKLIYNVFNNIIVDRKFVIENKDGNFKNNNFDNLIKIPKNKIQKIKKYDAEKWKPIEGYENRYVINREGQILSLLKNKILVDNHRKKYNDSYITHGLINEDGKRINEPVHRLVYSVFNNISINEYGDKVIDHIDKNKLNNKLANLRLVSISDNNKNREVKYNITKRSEQKTSDNFKIINKLIKTYDLSNYEVNDYGQVRNILNRNKILLTRNNRGYIVISLHPKNSKKSVNFFIHQLVAFTFINNPKPEFFDRVNHIDENKSNNYISNLEWIDHRNNIIHTSGKKVGQYSLDGNLINTFRCITDAFKGINKKTTSGISLVCNGKKTTAYGFKWKFIDENNNPIESTK